MLKKVITDKEFEQALNDINNVLIMNKVVAPFRRTISEDELHSCKLFALWESMLYWNTGGKKFTSFLWQRLKWECIKLVQQKQKNKHYYIETDIPDNDYISFDEIIEKLPPDMQDILTKRYVHKMTLREIGNSHGMCHETIRRKINKSIKILKSGV